MNLHMDVPNWLYEARRHMEMAIAGTPTSDLRTKMTDVNIALMAIEKEVEALNHPKPPPKAES